MRVLVTGSADGLGHASADALLAGGHQVVVHVRNEAQQDAVSDLVRRGALVVVADLAHLDQVHDLAGQVNALGRMDAVIHNAGVGSGTTVPMVNVVAPYVLTAALARPSRLVYLSSGMHRGGSFSLRTVRWDQGRTVSYSDSKLYATALAMAVARLWPEVTSNAVDPGWVPTRMGGPGAPDDLVEGHLTQVWLATSDDPAATSTGGYWHHLRREQAHRQASDVGLQDALLTSLAGHTGVRLDGAR